MQAEDHWRAGQSLPNDDICEILGIPLFPNSCNEHRLALVFLVLTQKYAIAPTPYARIDRAQFAAIFI